MATKGKKKSKGMSKADFMRHMRENQAAPDLQNPKEKAKQEREAKKAAEKESKAAEKAAAKQAKEDAKAAKKAEREAKAAQRKADKEAKAAARKPKTGALTVEQFSALVPAGTLDKELPELTEDQKIALADKGDKEMREFEGRLFRAALITRQFMVYELWKVAPNPKTGERGYKSIQKWAESVMPISRSQRYQTLAVAEKVIPHMSDEDLKKIGPRNMRLLIDVPKAKLADPEIIEAAKGSEKKLRKVLAKKAPEAGVEETEHVFVPKQVKENLDEAIAAIIALHELSDKAEALEGLGIYFMQGQTEHPDFAGMSNRDAYNALLERENQGEAEQEPASAEVQ